MKAQATVEFVIAFGLVLFVFMFLIAVMNNHIGRNAEPDDDYAEFFMDKIEQKVEFVRYTDSDTTVKLFLPPVVNGQNYSLHMHNESSLNRSLLVFSYEYETLNYTRFIPEVRNLTNFKGKGEFELRKNATGIYLVR